MILFRTEHWLQSSSFFRSKACYRLIIGSPYQVRRVLQQFGKWRRLVREGMRAKAKETMSALALVITVARSSNLPTPTGPAY